MGRALSSEPLDAQARVPTLNVCIPAFVVSAHLGRGRNTKINAQMENERTMYMNTFVLRYVWKIFNSRDRYLVF